MQKSGEKILHSGSPACWWVAKSDVQILQGVDDLQNRIRYAITNVAIALVKVTVQVMKDDDAMEGLC